MQTQPKYSASQKNKSFLYGASGALAAILAVGCVFGAQSWLAPTSIRAQAPQGPQWNSLQRADPSIKMGLLDLAQLTSWVQANSPDTKTKSTLGARFPALKSNIESAVKNLNRASVKQDENQPAELATARDSAGVYAVLNLEFESDKVLRRDGAALVLSRIGSIYDAMSR